MVLLTKTRVVPALFDPSTLLPAGRGKDRVGPHSDAFVQTGKLAVDMQDEFQRSRVAYLAMFAPTMETAPNDE
jgi:hypothetical protein